MHSSRFGVLRELKALWLCKTGSDLVKMPLRTAHPILPCCPKGQAHNTCSPCKATPIPPEAPKVTLATSGWVTMPCGSSPGLMASLGSTESWSVLGTGQGIPMRSQAFGVVEKVQMVLGVQGHLHAEAKCLVKSWDQGMLRGELYPHCQGMGTSSKGIHVAFPAQLGLGTGTWCGVLVGWDQLLQRKSWGWGCCASAWPCKPPSMASGYRGGWLLMPQARGSSAGV